MNGNDLAKEAVKDVKSMVDLALEAAKTEIVDQMVPGLKKLIEQRLQHNKSLPTEDVDRLRRAADGYGETEFEEGKGDLSMDQGEKDKEMEESLAGFFPSVNEEDEPMEMEEVSLEMEGMDGACGPDDEMKKESAEMEEEVEVSEDAIREYYEESLKTEAQVKKGFGAVAKGGDFGKDKPDTAGGIADMKSGEQEWDQVDVSNKQDYSVKEAIKRGVAENRALRQRVSQLQETCNKLYSSASLAANKLQEVNLFNAKLLHGLRFLNRHGKLTNEQKRKVIERFEKARSIQEVKMVYETVVESFQVAQNLSESKTRKPIVDAQRARASGAPNQEILRESVDKGADSAWNRIQMLAGLKR